MKIKSPTDSVCLASDTNWWPTKGNHKVVIASRRHFHDNQTPLFDLLKIFIGIKVLLKGYEFHAKPVGFVLQMFNLLISDRINTI